MIRAKVLITGGAGLLGVNWALTVRKQMDVTLGIHQRKPNLKGVDTLVLDLNSAEAVREGFDLIKPNIVIHAAGLTNVERCERYPSEARNLNVGLAENVATLCAEYGIPLAHISTDHVYAGDKPNREECEEPSPVNEYAKTKRLAEERVIAACPNALVVRTNFFGWGMSYRRSFSDVIINAMKSNREIQLFHDVYYTPILIEVLVGSVHDLLAVNARGIIHVVGDERISKYEFGMRLVREFGLNEGLVRPISIMERGDLIRRPLDMSLSNHRAKSILGRGLGNIQEYFARLKWQEKSGIADELVSL